MVLLQQYVGFLEWPNLPVSDSLETTRSYFVWEHRRFSVKILGSVAEIYGPF